MARHRTLITYLAAYFFAVGTAVRTLDRFRDDPSLPFISSLLVIFLLLIVVEPWLSRRSQRYTYLYLIVQIGMIWLTIGLITAAAYYVYALWGGNLLFDALGTGIVEIGGFD